MGRIGARVQATPGELGAARTWVLLLVTLIALVGGGMLAAGAGSGNGAATAADGGSDAVVTPVPASAVPEAVSANADIAPKPPRCTNGSIQLTFDDGPDPARTPALLDLLHAWGAKATFFVIGEQVSAYPDLVRREAAEGHRVGNHTWTHPYLTKLDPGAVADELSRTSDVIAQATGKTPTLWRPPYGDRNAAVIDEATRLGMRMVLWQDGTDSLDWEGLTPEQIAKRVVGNSQDGSIVLMHDIHQNTLDALPLVLSGLREKGLCAR